MRKIMLIVLCAATAGILAHFCFRKMDWYQNSVGRVLNWFRDLPSRVGDWFRRDKADPAQPLAAPSELAQQLALLEKFDAVLTKAEKMEPGVRDTMIAKFAQDNNLK